MAGSTVAMLGAGTKLSYSTTFPGPGTYTDISEVVDINPDFTVDEVENVTLDSDFSDYEPTQPSGECTFSLRYKPGNAAVKAIQGMVLAPAKAHWKITYPDGSTFTFDGFAKGFSKTVERNEYITAEVPLRITTLPVFTEAA